MNLLKNKNFKIMLIVEAVIILFGIALLFIPNKSYEYSVNGEGLPLKAGMYTLDVEYQADIKGMMEFKTIESATQKNDSYNQLVSEYIKELPSYRNNVSFDFRLNHKTDSFIVRASAEIGNLSISRMTVRETKGDELTFIFGFIFYALIANLLYFWWFANKNNAVSKEKNVEIIALIGMVFVASLGIMLPGTLFGHDTAFHINRIEGVKDCLINGQFPAKVHASWLNGNGYAVSVFYGDLFLYLPAVMRIMGFTISTCYRFYILCFNVATAWIAYYCFKKMSGNQAAALVVSAAYTLSLYRIIDVYLRASLGEYTALTFIPLVIYGLWAVFHTDVNASSYTKAIIPLVIGYTGIVESHILTTLWIGVITIVICVINIKKVFRKKTFAVLCIAAFVTLLLNLWYLIPLITYMDEDLNINNPLWKTAGIQEFGATFFQLFTMFPSSYGMVTKAGDPIVGEMPITMGVALFAGAVIYLYRVFADKAIIDEKKYTVRCAVGGAVFVFASTILFPWDFIRNLSALTAKVVISLQFPWRMLGFACVFLLIPTLFLVKWEEEHGKKLTKYVVIGLTLFQGLYSISGILNENGTSALFYHYETVEAASGGEYLPSGTKREDHKEVWYRASDNISVNVVENTEGSYTFDIVGNDNDLGFVNTSIVYYKGYKVVNTATKEKFDTYPDENGRLYFIVPPQANGTYKISFIQPSKWVLSYIVSLLTAVGIACYVAFGCYLKKKKI